ncbi:MAG: SLC13 family permease [Deltaproteobacteria bacterium]|nr:SLC13 family permease [Deltaproteobacteria bacterium]
MSPDAALTLVVVVGVAVGMARDRWGPDLVMFTGLAVLVVAGVIDPEAALRGFANPALMTIASLFIVAVALQETGALLLISRVVFGKTRNPRLALVRMVVPSAVMSGFMNNTPIVAMLIPVVQAFAKRVGESPSRFLMPLSFAAILGGSTTLIGTSGNLVVSGMLADAGQGPLGMFEISAVGVPVAVVGVLYLVTVGTKLLPARLAPDEHVGDGAVEYLAEVVIEPSSPLVDRTVEGADLRHLPGLFLVEIRRSSGRVVRPVAPETRLAAEDHLVFTGLAHTVKDLTAFPGLRPLDATSLEAEEEIFQVVVSHRSDMVGRTVRDANFRRRFGAAILAVHRAGERIEEKIGDIALRPGDTLMLIASPGFLETHRHNANFYLASALEGEGPKRWRHAQLSLGVLGLLVVLPALTGLSMTVAAMGAVGVLLATGSVSPRRARAAVNWPVLVVIGAALGIAQAMEQSGAAAWVAKGLLELSAPFGPRGTLAAVYLLGLVFASLVSNAAAAALVFPVAWGAATAAGLDPRPFAVGVALASSAVFSTPMSYAHLLIWSPGGYRYSDFVRMGLPLNLLVFAVAMALIPLAWPF